MKVLLVGSGSRESALGWKIRQSPVLTDLWAVPVNAYTTQIAKSLFFGVHEIEEIAEEAEKLGIDLVVIGPEVPLAMGIVDRLRKRGIKAFGPTKAAARIESSKIFAARLMKRIGVPQPAFHEFADPEEALQFAREHGDEGWAVKADGLAAGKAVEVCSTKEEVAAAITRCMLEHHFGSAGDKVFLQEKVEGTEISAFGFSDGTHLSRLIAACDFKRLRGDTGPNTGGMASYAPPAFWNAALERQVHEQIMEPVIAELMRRGTPYVGVLYAGLMITKQDIKVLEFNCRLGDPEAQVILPLLESDPLEVMLACVQGRLNEVPVIWNTEKVCVSLVMVDSNYPNGKPQNNGSPVTGLEAEEEGTLVFPYALTRHTFPDGKTMVVLNGGGRRVTVVGIGKTFEEALQRAQHRRDRIDFPGAYSLPSIQERKL